jgi:hypothetical protein
MLQFLQIMLSIVTLAISSLIMLGMSIILALSFQKFGRTVRAIICPPLQNPETTDFHIPTAKLRKPEMMRKNE